MSIIIDVSHHQGTIDWAKVAATGVRGAFIKATEGRTVRDPKFKANMTAAWRAGIVTGPYHFAHPNNNPASVEARAFLDVIGEPGKRTLPAVLDIEDNCEGMTPRKVQLWVSAFRKIVAEAGWPVWTYSYVPFMATYGLTKVEWVARYAKTPPAVPYDLWQYSSKGVVAGIGGLVDLNRLPPKRSFDELVVVRK